ncbi:acyl carrier protein [Corynebacterium sp.]|uniref:acyl carrier protein n=1 Tax=Corynebacterium sp. TaxID=1720 RepID=UPI0026DB05FE|nr:acyl carrier protein [Corynebacterium sp.]MDO5031309.1 acyl carrier protein [Corynebacterium sp.]
MANDLSAQLQARFGNASPTSKENAAKEDAAGDTYGQIVRLIATATGGDKDADIERDMRLEDLGVESLERIELAIRIEETCGVRLNEAAMDSLHTVGDLVSFVEEKQE